MRRSGTSCFYSPSWWPAATAAILALLSASSIAQAPPRATPIAYDRETQKSIISDLTSGLMDGFSSRTRTPGASLSSPTQQLRAVRPIIRDFADQATQLGYLLGDEARRIPSLRPLLSPTMNVSAMADSLDKNAQRFNDHLLLQDDFQKLDANWRALAYRLSAVGGVSKDVRDNATTLNKLDEQIRGAIGIRPQVNRRELWQKCNDLALDLRNLMDDIQVELRGSEGKQFLVPLSRARQQALTLAASFEDQTADMDFIVDQYQQFQNLWYPQRTKLQGYSNRYFERSLRHITQTDGEIHQLLLLPTKVDSQQLIYLTSELKKDIDDFFDRVSLKLVMHMPKADRVAGVASEFYGVCEHFVDQVQHNAKYDQLVEAFRYIESAQSSFTSVFSDLPSEEGLASLQQIAQTIDTLRNAMSVQNGDGFDRQRAVDLAASVESFSEQLEWLARRWLTSEQPPFANACLTSIRDMRQNLGQLHQDLVGGGSPAQYRRDIEVVYDTWRQVYNDVIKCQTEDRPQLGRLSSRITPALVELRTTLTQ